MNIFETTQIIYKWINSCDTSDQLNLCDDLVKDYVVNRFGGLVEKIDLVHCETDLRLAINDRRLLIANPSQEENKNKREPNISDIP